MIVEQTGLSVSFAPYEIIDLIICMIHKLPISGNLYYGKQ